MFSIFYFKHFSLWEIFSISQNSLISKQQQQQLDFHPVGYYFSINHSVIRRYICICLEISVQFKMHVELLFVIHFIEVYLLMTLSGLSPKENFVGKIFLKLTTFLDISESQLIDI